MFPNAHSSADNLVRSFTKNGLFGWVHDPNLILSLMVLNYNQN
jgi:hypothetical protein